MISFAQPWMLLAFAGLALPLLAHMVHRQTTTRLHFPSLRFIRIAQLPKKGRGKPVDILLMLLRMLILALIILIVSGMQFTPKGQTGIGVNEQTVLVLDVSASMSGWEAAEEAEAIVKQYLDASGSQMGLVSFGRGVKVSISPDEGKDAIRNVSVQSLFTAERGMPQAGIEEALKLFDPEVEKKRMILISDFQASDWQNVTGRLDSAGVALTVHKIAGDRDGNTAILHGRMTPAQDDNIRVSLTLANYSSGEVKRTLYLKAGSLEQTQTVTLAADQVSQAQFVIPKGEYQQGSVRFAESDVYALDDSFHLWMKVPPVKTADVLIPPLADEVLKEEAFFLKAALESSVENEWQSIEVGDRLDGYMGFGGFPDVHVLVVPGVSSDLGSDTLEELKDFVNDGGVILATLGQKAAETLGILKELEMLDCRYTGVTGAGRSSKDISRINWVNPYHRLEQVFIGDPRKDLFLTSINRHTNVKLGGDAEVLLKISGGHPALIENKIGAGRFVLFTFRLDTTSSDLPLRNSFLPMIREMVTVSGEDLRWPRLEIGDSLTVGDLPFDAKEAGLFSFADTFIAVNSSRLESVPEALSEKLIRESLGSRIVPENAPAVPVADSRNTVPLWPWLAMLAVFLYILENVLAKPQEEDVETFANDPEPA